MLTVAVPGTTTWRPLADAVTTSATILCYRRTALPPFWNGTLDEPAIWNRALSAAEIAALYAAGISA